MYISSDLTAFYYVEGFMQRYIDLSKNSSLCVHNVTEPSVKAFPEVILFEDYRDKAALKRSRYLLWGITILQLCFVFWFCILVNIHNYIPQFQP